MTLLPSPAMRAVTVLLVALGALPAAAAVLLGAPLLAAVILAAAVVPAIVSTPVLALVVLVTAEVANLSEGVGSHAGLSVYLATLALATAALVVGIARGTARLVWSPLYIFAGLFVITRALSITAATQPALAMADTIELAKALVFLVVVTSLICSTRSFMTVTKAVTLTALLLAGLSGLQEFVLHNGSSLFGLSSAAPSTVTTSLDPGTVTGRQSGPESDPNFWARSLLLFIPLGLSLLATGAQGRLRRVLWGVCVVALCFGVLLTGSRGGLLAAAACVVGWLLLAGPRQRRLLLATPLIFAAVFAVPGVGSRLGTLGQLKQANAATIDPSLAGRLSVQGAGLRMLSDHPALGIGAANFESVVVSYAREAGYAMTNALAPHDLYLQMAAEGGLIGFAGWILFYAAAMFVAARAFLLSGGFGRGSPERWLAVGVIAALIGWALASIFLHLSYLRVLLIVMALGAALDAELMSRATASAEADNRVGAAHSDGQVLRDSGWRSAEPAILGPLRRQRPLSSLSGVFVLLVGLAALAMLGQLNQPLWESTAGGLVSPRNNQSSAGNAYQYDTLTRNFLLPTEAAVLGSPRFRADALTAIKLPPGDARDLSVTVSSSPTSALVYVTARSPRADDARRVAVATFDAGRAYVNDVTPVFIMNPVNPVTTRQVQRTEWGNVAAIAAIAVLVDVAVRALRRRRRQSSSSVLSSDGAEFVADAGSLRGMLEDRPSLR